jgi:hypothetical protein
VAGEPRSTQEEEPDGGVLVTVLKDAPLHFRARACTNRLGVGDGRRADTARRNHSGGYEQYAHDGGDHSEAEEPRLCHSTDANLVSKRVNARGRLRLRCTPLRIPKREAPDVKLNWLLVADR